MAIADSICVAPKADLSGDIGLLDRSDIALLFKIFNQFGQQIDWEWSTGAIGQKKVKRSGSSSSAVHGGKVTAEVKFSDGTRNVVLSDLVYGEDWVLLCEKKEGAAKSKKIKQPAVSKKAKATGERFKK